MMLLNEEELVIENEDLVHWVAKKIGYFTYSTDYEDIISEGKIGLIKAIRTFDEKKNFKFSSYAVVCIENEMRMYYRKNNKHKDVISFQNAYDDSKSILNIISDSSSDFIEQIEIQEDYRLMMYYILNYLSSKGKIVMLYRLAEIKETEIARKLNISQSNISKEIHKNTEKLKFLLEKEIKINEKFSVNIKKELYYISFVHDNIISFKKFLYEFRANLEINGYVISGFRFVFEENHIILIFKPCAQNFKVLADFMYKMDKYEAKDIQKNTVKEIRDYILTIDSKKFTKEEIRKQFPNASHATINNTTRAMKNKGLIELKGKSTYIIVKNI